MKVLKFGGTSVGSAAALQQVQKIVLQQLTTNPKLVVVVSALGGVTDFLINTAKLAEQGSDTYREQLDEWHYRHRKIAEQLFTNTDDCKDFINFLKNKTREIENLLNGIYLIKELSARTLDCIVSYGEGVSSYLIAQYFKTYTPTNFIDSTQVIKTDSNFGNAKVNFKHTNQLLQSHIQDKSNGLYIMGGFIASNEKNVITTLGRGGSDYTAAIVGAALNAQIIEIWTDVDGVMTADPRKVTSAFSILDMTYEEALEMSHFGAKVIHPPTVQPALDNNIPLCIKNTFNPNFPGTLISKNTSDKRPVKGITSIQQISMISVQGSGLIGVTGIAGRLFTALARNAINIILITQASSEHSICFAVSPNHAENAKKTIETEFEFERKAHLIDEVIIENELSIIAIIGSNMKNTVGISGAMFAALGKNGVNIRAIAQGSSELNISTVVSKIHEVKSLNALHEAFFLSGVKSIHLYLVGVGLIGQELLKQIENQKTTLKNKQGIELKLIGIANSRKMYLNQAGINLDNYEDILQNSTTSTNLQQFVNTMQTFNLANSIFIDCTANNAPVEFYTTILQSSISIVTPNKIANSGSIESYLNYRKTAKTHRVKFLYETNVGAGLPIISTLTDLLESGDEILKIEAVLSGSLSFIFNTFTTQNTFSSRVIAAQEKGYTEPDPRTDLSGTDIARKVLILAREIGLNIEISEIEIQQILPTECLNAPTVPTFFEALKKHDSYFTQQLQNAQQNNAVLRCIATIQNSKSSINLQQVSTDNPFYQLGGSDNMIVFTTQRYKDRPLVIKGPGAGSAVTAAGVFAEIIKISAYLT